jgi:ABC-type glycerol-3-phosphate transport system substrate-binding protein
MQKRIVVAIAVIGCLITSSAARAQELTLWTHWAAEQVKRSFVEDAIQKY